MNKPSLFTNILNAGIVLVSVISPIKIEAFTHNTNTSITIRFASEEYHPFTWFHPQEGLQGFDIDIAKALCEKINARCTFSYDKFSDMISSLNTHRYDAWINAITITEERQKQVGFSKPYFSTKAMLIATNATVFNAAPVEIKGRTIGAGEHTCYAQYLQDHYKNTIKIKTFHTQQESLEALDKGEVDAIIDDEMVLKHWRSYQKEPKKYRLINLPAKYTLLVWHKYGIAIAKGNDELVESINHAIDHINADGTYDMLIKKHFP